MIKVKLSKKTLNEIERGSYQEKYSSAGGETKTMLDNIFQGKMRLIKPITLSNDVVTNNEGLNKFLTRNAEAVSKQLYNLYAVSRTGNAREDITARLDKIKTDPVRNYLINMLPVLRDDPDEIEVAEAEDKIRLLYLNLLYTYFSHINDAAKHRLIKANVDYDFDNKLVIIEQEGSQKPITVRMSIFMRTIAEITELLNTELIQAAEKDGTTTRINFNSSPKIKDNVIDSLVDNNIVRKFVRYFVPILREDTPEDIALKTKTVLDVFSFHVLSHPQLNLERIDLFLNKTTIKNEMILKICEKYLFEYATASKEGNYIIYTRVPRDVVRMSDFPNLKSCHTPVYPDEPAEDRMYASCATQEASSKGGAVAYLFKGNVLSKETISKLESSNEEFMKDPRRNIDGLIPLSRLRVRTIGILDDSGKEITLHVPDSKVYGTVYQVFIDSVYNFLKELQANQLAAIANISGGIKLKIYGGGYTDSSLAVKINSFIGRDVGFIKDREYSTHYEDSIGAGLDKIEAEYDKAFKSVLSDEAKQVIDMEYKSEKFFEGDDSPSQGYFTGHPRPEEIDTRTPKIFVNPIAILTSNTISMLLKENFKNLEGKDLTRNIAIPTNEFKNFCLRYGFKKIGSVFKDTSMLFHSEEVTNNVYAEISNDGQRIDVFAQMLIEDLKNPKKVKEYFNIDVTEKKPEMPLQEVKNIFKRFM